MLSYLSQAAAIDRALVAIAEALRPGGLTALDLCDFSYAEAAQILDVPIGTVMSRLHRGRRILKKELADLSVESA